jgi:hypothetical protein
MSSSKSVCTWFGINCPDLNAVRESSQVSRCFPFDGIDKAQNLKTLVLDSIAATLLDGVGAAHSLVNLNVASNRLTSLPVVSNLISLKELNVGEYLISGPIPTWLNDLPSLTVLKASQNEFSGPVYDFAGLSEMTSIDLFTSTLPAMLANATGARTIVVDLTSDLISGTVPSTSLSRFPCLSINLADTGINSNDSCNRVSRWSDNHISTFGCDTILCPIGFSNSIG